MESTSTDLVLCAGGVSVDPQGLCVQGVLTHQRQALVKSLRTYRDHQEIMLASPDLNRSFGCYLGWGRGYRNAIDYSVASDPEQTRTCPAAATLH